MFFLWPLSFLKKWNRLSYLIVWFWSIWCLFRELRRSPVNFIGFPFQFIRVHIICILYLFLIKNICSSLWLFAWTLKIIFKPHRVLFRSRLLYLFCLLSLQRYEILARFLGKTLIKFMLIASCVCNAIWLDIFIVSFIFMFVLRHTSLFYQKILNILWKVF